MAQWFINLLQEAKSHWRIALVLAIVFAIVCAPVGHAVYMALAQDAQIAVLVQYADGTPVANATVVCNYHDSYVSNQFGGTAIPRSTHTIQCFYSNEPLLIRNTSPKVFRYMITVDLNNSQDIILIVKHTDQPQPDQQSGVKKANHI